MKYNVLLKTKYYIKLMDFKEYIDINSTNRVEQMRAVQDEGLELFKRKNADYGDAFANYGVVGVLVRMGDKIKRLQHITKKKIQLVNDESLRDTLIDLHNYSAMAIMLLNENENTNEIIISEAGVGAIHMKNI